MRRLSAVVCTVALWFGLATPAVAATHARHFKNCTDMHKTYKGGVALPKAKDRRAHGHARYAPHRSTSLYNANKKMDRDHDGIACEQ